jgi:hypothetical protein
MATGVRKKNRRPHCEGSITQRKDGLWHGRLDLGYVNGVRKHKDLYGKTQREVVEKLAKVKRDLQQGLPVTPERKTVGKFLEDWLGRGAVLLKIRASTFDIYSRIVRLYLLPPLARIPLSKLTASHLNSLYADLLEKGLSPRTVTYAHSIMHRALKDALKSDLVARNVADAADAPRQQRKEMTPPTPEQLNVCLEVLRQDRMFALFVLAVVAGCRQGELLGLKWPDINLDEAQLQIRRTVYRSAGSSTSPRRRRGAARLRSRR